MLTIADVYSQIYRNTFEKKNLVNRGDDRLTDWHLRLMIEDFLSPIVAKKLSHSYHAVEIPVRGAQKRLPDQFPGVVAPPLTFSRGLFFVFCRI